MAARRPPLRRGEWRWPAAVTGVLLALTLGPIVVAWLRTPPGTDFTGYVVIGVDAPVYIAAWRQGWAGAWLFHAMYTSESIPPVLIYPWYIWSGHLVGALAGPWLYHLARLWSGAALLMAIYALAAELFRPRRLRQLAFVLAALGGGIGPLLGNSAQVGPLRLRATETLVSGTSAGDLLSMAPHLPWAGALLCFLFTACLRYRRNPSRRVALAALSAQLGLALIYPQLALLGVIVLAALACLDREWPGLVLAPYAGYLALLALRSPTALSPLRFSFELGDPFGFLVLSHLAASAIIVAAFGRGHLPRAFRLPALWIVGMTVLMFVPGLGSVLGRSFLASSIPFGMLAAAGLIVLRRRLRRGAWRRRLVAASLAGSSLFGLYSLVQPYEIAAGRLDRAVEYESRPEAQQLAGLAPATHVGDIVLTTYLEGLFVPAQTNARVYAGHPDQTIDAPRKARLALDFFDTFSAADRDAFLRQNAITYVLSLDPARTERLLADPMLRQLRQVDGSTLFAVRR
jgi:hypothetical protein